MKRNSTIVKDLNKLFPPSNPSYPVAFLQDDVVKVSAENVATESFIHWDNELITIDVTICDYYESYMADELVEYADSVGGYFEWENAGCMVLSY